MVDVLQLRPYEFYSRVVRYDNNIALAAALQGPMSPKDDV